MNWYGKTPPALQNWLRHWVVTPGKRLFSRGVIKQPGFVIAKRLDQSIPFKLSREGYYEPQLSALFRQYLRAGDTFIDIGANIGYFTLLAASCVGATGHIHSFEPNPTTFKGLQRNVTLNNFKQVSLNNAAVSNVPGQVQLWVGKEIDSGLVSMRQTSSLLTDTVTSQAMTLDEYVIANRVGKIRAMKLDIEGAEWLALQGAQQLLIGNNRPDLIALEAVQSHAAAFGVSIAQLIEFLIASQYTVHLLPDDYEATNRLVEIADRQQPPDGTLVVIAE
ncbi:MAG: FkbM family methyltransferase [Chloroflexi bacterium]|nr:FkbM family methyltransferase [Chloroflexota bacterium]